MNAEQSKYEKLRSKHGGPLQKLQANREELKKKGTVKSWLEVFVLVNEDRQMFTQPVAQHLTKGESAHNLNPYVQIGLIVPPNAYQAPQVPRPSAAQSSPTASPVMRLYEQLPTPQNPKLVLANDRKAYDNALDAQLEAERSKLVYLKMAPDATNRQIQAQIALVDQLVQQQEMVQQQHAQNQANKQRVQQKKQREQAQAVAPVAAAPAPAPPATLEDRIKAFFRKHEPEALTDGRVDAVLMWTQERGEDKLNAMLREQYGQDLLGQLNVDSTFVDQVQADRIARRLNGFYHAKQVFNVPESECQKIGEWACKAGEAALNAKLRAKYNDDLDSYAQSIMLQVETKLRAFYLEKNPEMMREKGIGPLLTWTVSNGIPALNHLLLEKYGEDLLGNKRNLVLEEKSERLTTMTRSILYRDLHREPSMATIKTDGDDVLDNRKQMLIRQFATFLEVQDPKRLTQGGLVPLVQWALPRTDKQVDELLLETYGVDLDDAGLRDFDFTEREVNQFHGAQERDSMAYLAGKAASVVMEDEFNRAEIRSQRAFTQDDPLLAMPQMFEDEEPDF